MKCKIQVGPKINPEGWIGYVAAEILPLIGENPHLAFAQDIRARAIDRSILRRSEKLKTVEDALHFLAGKGEIAVARNRDKDPFVCYELTGDGVFTLKNKSSDQSFEIVVVYETENV